MPGARQESHRTSPIQQAKLIAALGSRLVSLSQYCEGMPFVAEFAGESGCIYKELDDVFKRTKQAFQAFRSKSFFLPEPEFIKSFTESVKQVEGKLQEMGSILSAFVSQHPVSTSVDEATPDTAAASHIPGTDGKGEGEIAYIGDHTPQQTVLKNSGAISSITPPASEAGNDDDCSSTDNGWVRSSGNGTVQVDIRKRGNSGLPCPPQPQKRSRRNLIDDYLKKDVSEKTKSAKEEEEDEEFEVESIVGMKKTQGQAWYLVKWKGYESKENTWEPPSNLTGCEELLFEFYKDRLKERENTDTDDMNNQALPIDHENKDILYRAFHVHTTPTEEEMNTGVGHLVSAKPPPLKTGKEVEELIEKALVTRKKNKYHEVLRVIMNDRVMKEASEQRKVQLAMLRTWERHINSICSDSARLVVENNADLAFPPSDFQYINMSLAGEGVTIPTDPVVGCECTDCSSSKSCCPDQMNTHVAYNKYGRLRVSLGTPVYECNSRCTCGPTCFNRVVQKGRSVGLCIFRTENGRGWGVKAMENIKKDSLVTEYVGEIITSEEAERRGKIYDAQGCTYLFDLDYNRGDQNPYTIDAAKCGNVSHFINHSCDPNLMVFNVWVNCLDPDLPRLALFATRDIKKGEELTFDYNSGLKREDMTGETVDIILTPEKGEQQMSSEMILKTPKGNRGLQYGKTECRCGAANCRKYFF